MRIFLSIFILLISFFATAQSPTDFEKASKLYSQVIRGERKFENLSANEKLQILTIQQVMSNSCSNTRGKCREACEAANELQSAADDLSRCAKNHDFTDDCDRRFLDTKDKFENYENAVSDTSGNCS